MNVHDLRARRQIHPIVISCIIVQERLSIDQLSRVLREGKPILSFHCGFDRHEWFEQQGIFYEVEFVA